MARVGTIYHFAGFTAGLGGIVGAYKGVDRSAVVFFHMNFAPARHPALGFQANQHFIPRKYDFICLHLLIKPCNWFKVNYRKVKTIPAACIQGSFYNIVTDGAVRV